MTLKQEAFTFLYGWNILAATRPYIFFCAKSRTIKNQGASIHIQYI